jgi:hypothetical protein
MTPLPYRRYRETLERLAGEFESQLRESIISEIKEYARVGEYELGFDLLCNMLLEYSVPVPRDTFIRIEVIGNELKLSQDRWTYLEPLITSEASDMPRSGQAE